MTFGIHQARAVLGRAIDRTHALLAILLIAAVPAVGGAANAASVQHVIIFSIDGLHQADLTDPATAQYLPHVLALQRSGITYTNARAASPSDEMPGTLAIVAGASPASTGIFYDDAYARDLWPPGTTAAQIRAGLPPGTQLHILSAEKERSLLSGGGATTGPGAYGRSAIETSLLPVDAAGRPVEPWRLGRVNTIFDVTTAAGMSSAFFGKHPAGSTLFEGPTGRAITDFYSPESAAATAILGGKFVDPSTAPAGTPTGHATDQLGPTGGNYQKMEAWDDLLEKALRNELDGRNALGDARQPTPAIIWLNLQSVDIAQKLLSDETGTGGIDVVDGVEVVNPALVSALRHSDRIVKSMIDRLKANGQFDSTLIVLTATHGNAPRLNAAKRVDGAVPVQALIAAGIGLGQVTEDDMALIWLDDQTQSAAAGDLLARYARTHSAVAAVFSGAEFGVPDTDSRTPDFVIQLNPGYSYFGCEGEKYHPVDCNPSSAARPTRNRAAHGNVYQIDDTQVPLIVSGGGLRRWQRGLAVDDLVFTTQIAPTILARLGLDWTLLDGVRLEGTSPLPNAVP